MQISTHPKELTRESVKNWLQTFQKKLKRTTSRDDLDRLILSVERMEFDDNRCALWEQVIFQNGKGKVFCQDVFGDVRSEECTITSFQKTIVSKNRSLLEGQKSFFTLSKIFIFFFISRNISSSLGFHVSVLVETFFLCLIRAFPRAREGRTREKPWTTTKLSTRSWSLLAMLSRPSR